MSTQIFVMVNGEKIPLYQITLDFLPGENFVVHPTINSEGQATGFSWQVTHRASGQAVCHTRLKPNAIRISTGLEGLSYKIEWSTIEAIPDDMTEKFWGIIKGNKAQLSDDIPFEIPGQVQLELVA